MGVGKKICKTCGKEYTACHTPNPNGVFRWRDVACSRECAEKYIEAIRKSREEDDESELAE